MKEKFKKVKKYLTLPNITGVLALLVISLVCFISVAHAAPNFTWARVRLDRMAASTATTGTVCAKPGVSATEGKVIVKFPSDFTINTTLANWTINTSPQGWSETGPQPTGWLGIGTSAVAADNGAKTVTFNSGDLIAGTAYCFNWSNATALTTGASASNLQGYVNTQTAGSVDIEKTAVAFAIIGSNADLITITAQVNPTFSFSLSGNTAPFSGALQNSATTETSGITATITTNAPNGWTTWVKSANAALHSASPGATDINTVGTYDGNLSTLSGGSPGYVLKVATSGGSSDAAKEYKAVGADDGGTLTTTYNYAAFSSAAASGDTVTFYGRARVSNTQVPASDYTDTLTVVAAGMF
jgi:hypothetical protein